MHTRIKTRVNNGYTSHDVYCNGKLLGTYWKNGPGDWEVELPSGAGWDKIDTMPFALELILENQECV